LGHPRIEAAREGPEQWGREEASMRTGIGITTTFVPILHETDGRMRFDAPKALGVRLLEAALAILWIVSAAVLIVAPILWF
jgi:hypothetical protein